jgi:hypothetical protein
VSRAGCQTCDCTGRMASMLLERHCGGDAAGPRCLRNPRKQK